MKKMIVWYELFLGLTELILAGSVAWFDETTPAYLRLRDQHFVTDHSHLAAYIYQRLVPLALEYKWYLAGILFILGLAKVVGAIGSFQNKKWGLDVLIVALGLLLPYELYEIFASFHWTKPVFFVLNAWIVWYLVGLKRGQVGEGDPA